MRMRTCNKKLGLVVGVDDSPAAKVALRWAARDAELRHIPLTLVHTIAVEVGTWLELPSPPGLARWQKDRARQLLDDAIAVVTEACRHGGPTQVNTELVSAATIPALVELSDDAEMVVIGSRDRRQWPGRSLGSVSAGLVRHAHCPVAVIHDEDPLMPHPAQAPVLVGVDGSSAAELATAIAFDEAAHRNVNVLALHACNDIDISQFPEIDWPTMQSMAEQGLAERLAGWEKQYPEVRVSRIVVRDQPARRLLEHADDAQLVVVGSRGRGGFAQLLLGSVSETVAQLARMPVIVARETTT